MQEQEQEQEQVQVQVLSMSTQYRTCVEIKKIKQTSLAGGRGGAQRPPQGKI